MNFGAQVTGVMPYGWPRQLVRRVDEPFTGESVLGRNDYINTRFYKEVIAPVVTMMPPWLFLRRVATGSAACQFREESHFQKLQSIDCMF
jgi:hypothetical protein